MAISINWATKIISIPRADLITLGGADYQLDLDVFRLVLKNIEDSDEGMAYPHTHNHVAPIVVGGVALARVVEIINGYTVTFEDVSSPYRVTLVGGNSNVADVTNINNVSVRPQNSAGLVNVSGGGGLTPTQASQLEQVLKLLRADDNYQANLYQKLEEGTNTVLLEKLVNGGQLTNPITLVKP